MEKKCYQEIIDEVSKKLAQKIISEEKDLARRATLIDKDVAGIVQDIGLQTTKKVIDAHLLKDLINQFMRGIEVSQETLLVDLINKVVLNESDIRNVEINA